MKKIGSDPSSPPPLVRGPLIGVRLIRLMFLFSSWACYARRARYKSVKNVDSTRAIVRVINQSHSHSLAMWTFGQALIKVKPTKTLKWNKNRLSEKDWLRPLLPSPFGRGSIVSFMTGLFSTHYTYGKNQTIKNINNLTNFSREPRGEQKDRSLCYRWGY